MDEAIWKVQKSSRLNLLFFGRGRQVLNAGRMLRYGKAMRDERMKLYDDQRENERRGQNPPGRCREACDLADQKTGASHHRRWERSPTYSNADTGCREGPGARPSRETEFPQGELIHHPPHLSSQHCPQGATASYAAMRHIPSSRWGIWLQWPTRFQPAQIPCGRMVIPIADWPASFHGFLPWWHLREMGPTCSCLRCRFMACSRSRHFQLRGPQHEPPCRAALDHDRWV